MESRTPAQVLNLFIVIAIAWPAVGFGSPSVLKDGQRNAPLATPGLRAAQGVGAAVWASRTAHRQHPALLVTKPKPKVTWVRARRLARLPESISHGLAVSWSGQPVRTRKFNAIRDQKVKSNETIRSVAYRACTSPQALAVANGIQWDPAGTPLPEGTVLKVPLRFRAASGFAKAVRLRTAPGVRAARIHQTWGRPYVVKLLQDAFRAVHQRWPNRHPFIVHDVSRFGGGRLGGHKSHRAGRDIDIGYPTFEATRKGWGRPALGSIDYGRLWFLVDSLERSGYVAAIYMSPRIQRRLFAHAAGQGGDLARLQTLFQYPCARGAKRTLIRHARGHRDHLHIRFASPADLSVLTPKGS
ncbi:MAG: penicillin-insensitive murein endopeptidase [Myxococcales bacterium]|nr:penicillin-insensitive murein endopeptidase [Myxococcales bacterium]